MLTKHWGYSALFEKCEIFKSPEVAFLGPVPQKSISATPGLKVNPPLDFTSQRLTQKANHGLVNWVCELCLNKFSRDRGATLRLGGGGGMVQDTFSY